MRALRVTIHTAHLSRRVVDDVEVALVFAVGSVLERYQSLTSSSRRYPVPLEHATNSEYERYFNIVSNPPAVVRCVYCDPEWRIKAFRLQADCFCCTKCL